MDRRALPDLRARLDARRVPRPFDNAFMRLRQDRVPRVPQLIQHLQQQQHLLVQHLQPQLGGRLVDLDDPREDIQVINLDEEAHEEESDPLSAASQLWLSAHVKIEGRLLSHCPMLPMLPSANDPSNSSKWGIYASSLPLTVNGDPVLVEVVSIDRKAADRAEDQSGIVLGMVDDQYDATKPTGHHPNTLGLDFLGLFYTQNSIQIPVKLERVISEGDVIGMSVQSTSQDVLKIVFTLNGISVFTTTHKSLLEEVELFPAIAIKFAKVNYPARVECRMSACSSSAMLVDEEDSDEVAWSRLHDVRFHHSTHTLEYVGRGQSLLDVGLAQSCKPLSTRHHYFEIEIVEPGAHCYIAIGLAHRNYPAQRHPGWNRGSVAYHADDGKIFIGSGMGSPFGPRCVKGDVMGCGILFPRDYSQSDEDEKDDNGIGGEEQDDNDEEEDEDEDIELLPRTLRHRLDQSSKRRMFNELRGSSCEEDEWWVLEQGAPEQKGIRVQVYFTRNGSIIGKRETLLPKGGFFPTVGMMSCRERVRVDLRPLTG